MKWIDIILLALVALAVFFAVRRLRRGGGCCGGSCEGCGRACARKERRG